MRGFNASTANKSNNSRICDTSARKPAVHSSVYGSVLIISSYCTLRGLRSESFLAHPGESSRTALLHKQGVLLDAQCSAVHRGSIVPAGYTAGNVSSAPGVFINHVHVQPGGGALWWS